MRFSPVLVYHAIGQAPDASSGMERSLFVDRNRFADQMEDLSRRGMRSLTLDEYAVALEARVFPRKSVLLTFDDAYAHVDAVVTPVLRRHGFTAAMFVPAGHLGSCNTWDATRLPNLAALAVATPDQIRAFDQGLWDIASHGLWHVDLRTVDPGQRRKELVQARERLGHLLRRPVFDLAYPHGAQDETVRDDVERAGYRMAFTAGYRGGVGRYELPRWPIFGGESLEMFRVKTSAWSLPLYRTFHRAPGWAKTRARVMARTFHDKARVN